MVLQELILTLSTWGELVILKELIFTLSTLAGCGGLEITNFNSFYFGRVLWS